MPLASMSKLLLALVLKNLAAAAMTTGELVPRRPFKIQPKLEMPSSFLLMIHLNGLFTAAAPLIPGKW